jgi:hypothetical protein
MLLSIPSRSSPSTTPAVFCNPSAVSYIYILPSAK